MTRARHRFGLSVGVGFRLDREPLRLCRRPFCLNERGHGCVVQHGEVAFLGFGRRDEADGLQKPAIVEPVHPLEGCALDGLEVAPRSASMDDLGLVETVDRFGEGVVVRVADAADGGLDFGFGEALGVLDRNILAAPDALLFVKRRFVWR